MERAAALVQDLAARGGPRLPALEWHDELGSTSDRLKDLARAGAPAWTVVVGERQTGGRGREGRTWQSPKGGLYLSVLLRPASERVSLIPLAAGIAVAEAVLEFGVRAELKWPNDVLVSGRKLAGILAEASSSGSGVEWVVLGVGVNVAVELEALPEPLRQSATSLAACGARDAPPSAVAAAALARLSVWYDALRTEPARVVAAWRAQAVPWWGELVEVRTAGGDR
ncbi:MAG TPA: biotin--[acetyl-CoA-carboxylase] ligase, partial [Planctomycetota bacterium]|nr:biotin--[acetyl-CoA-carboxylase] ligase [Planctomycetota bacterium]